MIFLKTNNYLITIDPKLAWNKSDSQNQISNEKKNLLRNYLDLVSVCWHTPFMLLKIIWAVPFNNKLDSFTTIISAEKCSNVIIQNEIWQNCKIYPSKTNLLPATQVYFRKTAHLGLSKYPYLIDSYLLIALYISSCNCLWLHFADIVVSWKDVPSARSWNQVLLSTPISWLLSIALDLQPIQYNYELIHLVLCIALFWKLKPKYLKN